MTEFTKNVTLYRLDYAQATTRPIAAYYAVKSHPVVLVIDPAGEVVGRWIGIPDADSLRQTIADVASHTPGK